jgi:hypothetical protein
MRILMVKHGVDILVKRPRELDELPVRSRLLKPSRFRTLQSIKLMQIAQEGERSENMQLESSGRAALRASPWRALTTSPLCEITAIVDLMEDKCQGTCMSAIWLTI